MTRLEIKSKFKKCFSELAFKNMCGRLKVPREFHVPSNYQILLKFPYYLELTATGPDDFVIAYISSYNIVHLEFPIRTPSQIAESAYEQFISDVALGFDKSSTSSHCADVKNHDVLNISYDVIKSSIANHLSQIITEAKFHEIDKHPVYFDPTYFSPNRMFSSYREACTGRFVEYHLSFLYYKAGEAVASKYPPMRISVEVEEANGKLTYKEFLKQLAHEIVSDAERELYHIYWVLGLDTVIKRKIDDADKYQNSDVYHNSNKF